MNVVGLMSGTSLDGIDAVLADFVGHDVEELRWSVRAALTVPYRAQQRQQIEAALEGPAAAICHVHTALGEWFAEAALAVCRAAGVTTDQVAVIGSHGQTIWHQPPELAVRGATLQLGDAATIAERTGIAVVSDFRARDVAAGGHGAPLVPWQDRALFSLADRRRVLLNLGGIANVSGLPPKSAAEPLVAFDTGPANMLIDAAVELATQGRETFDRDGRRASSGTVDERLATEVMAHPFFDLAPPKSTGREAFGREFLIERLCQRMPTDEAGWNNVIATLTAVTARTVADAIRRWLPQPVDEIVVSGGGARNRCLVDAIKRCVSPVPVYDGSVLGVDADYKEALAFALFAWAHLHDIPCNCPEVTGASGPRVLGCYTPGRYGYLARRRTA